METTAQKFRLGTVIVDLESGTVTSPSGVVALRPVEQRLLGLLARHAPEVVTRQQLLQEVWGYAATTRTRTIGTTVSRLRPKLEEASKPQHLLTVHGAGFRLVGLEPVDDVDPPLVQALARAVRDGRRLIVLTGERSRREQVARSLSTRLGPWRLAADESALDTPGIVLWCDPPERVAPALARWIAADARSVAVVAAPAALGLYAETVVEVGGSA